MPLRPFGETSLIITLLESKTSLNHLNSSSAK